MRGLYKSSHHMLFCLRPDTSLRNAYYSSCTFPVMHIRWFMLIVLLLSGFVVFGGCTSTTSPSAAQSPSGSSQPAQSGPQVQSATSAGILTLRVDSLARVLFFLISIPAKGPWSLRRFHGAVFLQGPKVLSSSLKIPMRPVEFSRTGWSTISRHGTGSLHRARPMSKCSPTTHSRVRAVTGSADITPPALPIGSTHRYIFRLYALDLYIALPTADRAAIDQALAGQTIAKTEFITTFSR